MINPIKLTDPMGPKTIKTTQKKPIFKGQYRPNSVAFKGAPRPGRYNNPPAGLSSFASLFY